MNERCRQICGKTEKNCFISNRDQLSCVADMILNKVSAASMVLESALRHDPECGVSEKVEEALKSLDALVSWIKFLQMAHDLRETIDLLDNTTVSEKRSEMRYPLPAIYQKYIGLCIYTAGSFLPVQLVNFSRAGMRFKSPESLTAGSMVEGMFFTERHPVKRKVSFVASVRHCTEGDGEFIIGVQFTGSPDEASLDFFRNVHDFIVLSLTDERERQGGREEGEGSNFPTRNVKSQNL